MLQLCMFGGYDGQLGPEAKVYFTMFGGCDLRRPTLARRMLDLRREGPDGARQGRKIIITIFGGTDITSPTLAEEFIDLREAVRSGALDPNRWDEYMTELTRTEPRAIMSFTLFGGFDEAKLPGEDQEVETLALQRHLGTITEESGRVLEMGVGQGGAQRRAVIHQAVMATC